MYYPLLPPDMAEIEAAVRSIKADGLLWGSSKLVPLAYGIKKLQISCVVEDDKVIFTWVSFYMYNVDAISAKF